MVLWFYGDGLVNFMGYGDGPMILRWWSRKFYGLLGDAGYVTVMVP